MGSLRGIDWVAAHLDVSKERAYELVRLGILPAVRLGRQVRVDESVVQQWIASGGTRQDAARPLVSRDSLARPCEQEGLQSVRRALLHRR